MTGISHCGAIVVRVVPREHEAVAHDRRVRCAASPCGSCAGCTGCSCTRRRRRTSNRGTGTASSSPRTVPPYAEVRAEVRAVRVLQVELARRRRATARARGSSSAARVTSPGARSSGNATWNQPNGIGNGKRRVMPPILEHVLNPRAARCARRGRLLAGAVFLAVPLAGSHATFWAFDVVDLRVVPGSPPAGLPSRRGFPAAPRRGRRRCSPPASLPLDVDLLALALAPDRDPARVRGTCPGTSRASTRS